MMDPRSRRPLRRAAGLLTAVVLVSGCGGTNDTPADNPDPIYGPAISESQAAQIALQATPGEQLEVRREVDHQAIVFNVIIRTTDDLLIQTQVDANTGEVVHSEQLQPDGRQAHDGGMIDGP